MAIQNATDVLLKVTTADGLEAIAHSTSASLSMSTDLRDATTKSSGGFQENLGGLKSWEMSGDAFVDITSPTGADIESLWTVWNNRSVISCTFGLSGMTYTGNAIITSLSIDAGVEENATFSITLTGTNTITQS